QVLHNWRRFATKLAGTVRIAQSYSWTARNQPCHSSSRRERPSSRHRTFARGTDRSRSAFDAVTREPVIFQTGRSASRLFTSGGAYVGWASHARSGPKSYQSVATVP